MRKDFARFRQTLYWKGTARIGNSGISTHDEQYVGRVDAAGALSFPLSKPAGFELAHLEAQSLLTGTPEQVAKKQRRVRIAA